jgi:hypothetical protein
MVSIDPGTAKEFLEGVIAAFAVLGGIVAYFSGFEASKALAENQPPTAPGHGYGLPGTTLAPSGA